MSKLPITVPNVLKFVDKIKILQKVACWKRFYRDTWIIIEALIVTLELFALSIAFRMGGWERNTIVQRLQQKKWRYCVVRKLRGICSLPRVASCFNLSWLQDSWKTPKYGSCPPPLLSSPFSVSPRETGSSAALDVETIVFELVQNKACLD